MTREDKCILAIKLGFTYNPKTGDIFGIKGKLIKRRNNGYIGLKMYDKNNDRKLIELSGHQFAWYYVHKECVEIIDHINRIKDDNRISNLRSATIHENANNTSRSVNGMYYVKFKIGSEKLTYCFTTKEEIEKYHSIFANLNQNLVGINPK